MKTIYLKSPFSLLFLSILFLNINFYCYSQSYQCRNYGIENGITQPYIYTINQDKNGYLWVGTGEGLFRFDGTKFQNFSTKDGLADNFVTTSFKDNDHNLWLGHNEGSVTFYDGKKFKSINTDKFIKSSITAITSDNKGDVWFSTLNDGILRVTKNFEVEIFKMELENENITSLAFTIDDYLIVGTPDGAYLYELKTTRRKPQLVAKIKCLPETKIQCIVRKKRSASFWVGTEDQGLFLLSQKNDKEYNAILITKPDDQITNILSIVEDKESNLWLGSFGNGLVKLILSEQKFIYDRKEVFPESSIDNKYIRSLYYDHEGNIWVGKYGSGITQITDNFFTFFNNSPHISNNITAIFIQNTTTWLGTDNGLILANFNNTSANREITPQLDAIGNYKITSLFQPDSNLLYIGTENSGLYLYQINTKKVTKINLNPDQLSNSINKIVGDKNVMWIATKTGLFKVDIKNNKIQHYNTENGLPHNNIHDIVIDHNKNIWLATSSNFLTIIYPKENDRIEQRKIYSGNDLVNAISIIEDKHNVIWIGSLGHGVFKIDDTQIKRFDTEYGLKSNYCYSIINDGFNNIWVGYRGGLSKIDTDNNSIVNFSKEENIKGDCNLNSFFRDKYGRTWFGTDKGLIRYDPTREKKNTIPPIINIISFIINDSAVDFTKDIVLPYGNYNLEINYLGISFKANPRITYQYKLDGYDADWSAKTTNTIVNYGKFPEGDYVFLLNAFNSDGVSNPTPLAIKIKIKPPWWKSWWAILLAIAVFFYSIYLIIKIRERNHRIFQAQLQKELNIKTREVIEQKEVIEKKNKDITDSIRYAKRIQDAMLPGLSKLKDVLPDSFVFFQPRDIVSGDFYWFELYDTKLIIVCADATGHGVPGSLMSMIGTILLKDITARPNILSPAHALETIDNEIKVLLQQTDETVDNNTADSIDIIICEIDIKTYKARISTTKRLLLLSHENKISVIKKEKSVSEYETMDIQLKKGDTLYLFTDGFADQFGGEKGKKLKLPNIISMLEEIHTLPAEKQRMIIDRHFNRWKEGYDQVDDVLFMGIKI